MRVHTERAPDVLLRPAQREEILRLVELGRRHEKALDPTIARPRDRRGARLRLEVLQVAVRIDEKGARAHFTRVPFGAPEACGRTRIGLPSASVAARIMPRDSTPMSFAGLRFATTTTWWPTSSSGV